MICQSFALAADSIRRRCTTRFSPKTNTKRHSERSTAACFSKRTRKRPTKNPMSGTSNLSTAESSAVTSLILLLKRSCKIKRPTLQVSGVFNYRDFLSESPAENRPSRGSDIYTLVVNQTRRYMVDVFADVIVPLALGIQLSGVFCRSSYSHSVHRRVSFYTR